MCKCKTLYFICKGCDETSHRVNNKAECTAQKVNPKKWWRKLLNRFKQLWTKQSCSLNLNLKTELKVYKLDEIMHATAFNDTIKEREKMLQYKR